MRREPAGDPPASEFAPEREPAQGPAGAARPTRARPTRSGEDEEETLAQRLSVPLGSLAAFLLPWPAGQFVQESLRSGADGGAVALSHYARRATTQGGRWRAAALLPVLWPLLLCALAAGLGASLGAFAIVLVFATRDAGALLLELFLASGLPFYSPSPWAKR
jgi:hypothetical protein